MVALYLGGARSGKSGLAEQAAFTSEANGKRVIYVATAQRHPTMAERIELHQARRPPSWQCIEEPLALAQLIERFDDDNTVLLVDCLTLWLTNHLLAGADLVATTAELIAALKQSRAQVLLVSTEVGHSLVPEDLLSQQYVIAAGELHQAIGAVADSVIWCSAGFGTELKQGNAAIPVGAQS